MSTAKAVVKPVENVVPKNEPKEEDLRHVEQGILLKRAIDGYHEIVNACLLSLPDAEALDHSISLLQTDIEQRFNEVFKSLCNQ